MSTTSKVSDQSHHFALTILWLFARRQQRQELNGPNTSAWYTLQIEGDT